MPQARRIRPRFAARQDALLWIPYRWITGISMALFAAPLVAFATHNLLSGRGGPVGFVLSILFGLAGLVMVCGGIRAAARHGPALTADEAGITASCIGVDRSRIPWELVSGACVVGKKNSERALVILTPDPEAWLTRADPMITSFIQKLNRKHKLSGALYIMARTMRAQPDLVAGQIEDLLAICRDDQQAPVEEMERVAPDDAVEA